MLRLMNNDLEHEDDADKKLGRRGIRDQLRFLTRASHPDGKPDHSPLEIESDEQLAGRLAAVASEAHGIQLLLEAVAFEPWATRALNKDRRGKLRSQPRSEALERA